MKNNFFFQKDFRKKRLVKGSYSHATLDYWPSISLPFVPLFLPFSFFPSYPPLPSFPFVPSRSEDRVKAEGKNKKRKTFRHFHRFYIDSFPHSQSGYRSPPLACSLARSLRSLHSLHSLRSARSTRSAPLAPLRSLYSDRRDVFSYVPSEGILAMRQRPQLQRPRNIPEESGWDERCNVTMTGGENPDIDGDSSKNGIVFGRERPRSMRLSSFGKKWERENLRTAICK